MKECYRVSMDLIEPPNVSRDWLNESLAHKNDRILATRLHHQMPGRWQKLRLIPRHPRANTDMCGIAGYFVTHGDSELDKRTLPRMVSRLRHRGPDGQGTFMDGPVGLGHARLSIIDVAGGAQPMCNEDESVWIAFNGEIFNYLELRRRVAAAWPSDGYEFGYRSNSAPI